MAVENPFPLNIDTKQDSWAKLQLLANVDPSFKIIAEEFNKMVQALEWLNQNSGTGGSGTPGWENIYFGAGAYTNTAGDSTTAAEIEDHINNIGFTVTAGKLIVIHITVKRQVNGQSVMMRELYTFNKNNVAGAYGTGETNDEITYSDLIIRDSKVITQVSGTTQVINLGDIGSTPIHTHINGLDPATISWENLTDGTTYYFETIFEGVEQIYQYVGTLPITLGNGNTSVDDVDFDLIFTSTSPGNEIFDLQATTENGAITNILSTFLSGANFGGDNGALAFIRLKGGVNGGDGESFVFSNTGGCGWRSDVPFGFRVPHLLLDGKPILSLDINKWNPNTNTFLNGDEELSGELRIASHDGTVNFGAGPISFKAGDILGYHDDIYIKLFDNNQSSGASILKATKPENTTRSNNDVLTLDPHLQLPVVSGQQYRAQIDFIYTSQGTPDFKFQLEYPSGSIGYWYADTGSLSNTVNDLSAIEVLNGFGSTRRGTSIIVLFTAGDDGTFGLKWAQNTSNASGTVVREDSCLIMI